MGKVDFLYTIYYNQGAGSYALPQKKRDGFCRPS